MYNKNPFSKIRSDMSNLVEASGKVLSIVKEASNETPTINHLELSEEPNLSEMTMKERTAFHMAAAAAAKAGKPHFEFGGKKFKSTMAKDVAHKMTEEPVETMKQVKMVNQEESHDTPPFDPDKPREKRPDEPTTAKGLARQAMRQKIEKIKQDAKDERKRLRKSLKEPMRKVEEESINEISKQTMKSYVKKALDTNNPKSISNLASRGGYELGKDDEGEGDRGEKYDRKAYLRSKGVQHAVNKIANEERHMTPGEMKKRERIAKSMKPVSDWEKRYPGRGKEVMYATATKQAMKEEIEVKEKSHASKIKEMVKTKAKAMKETKGGKTMTGQTKDQIETNPVHKDGIMSGANVKSGA